MPGPIEALKAYFAAPGEGTPQRPFAPWQKTLQGGVDAVSEAFQGLLGVGQETKPNLVGQMISAGAPLVGGVRGALTRAATKTAAPLAMDEASRMARAAEQGYTMPVYHGTRVMEDFPEFRPAVASHGDFGIHVTPRPETANKVVDVLPDPEKFPPHSRVLPLLARSQKQLTLPDVGLWKNPRHWVGNLAGTETNQAGFGFRVPDYISNDPEAAQELFNIAKKYTSTHPYESAGIDPNLAFQQDIKAALQRRGYDTIKYNNFSEGAGEPSYLLLDPRQLRSKFAAFDPAKFGKTADLMAGIVPPVALAGLIEAGKEKK